MADTPKTLELASWEGEFVAAVFDGAGNILYATSFPTEEEARQCLAEWKYEQESWEEDKEDNGGKSTIDPPMWDIYKRGTTQYERFGRAEATVRHPFSDGSM